MSTPLTLPELAALIETARDLGIDGPRQSETSEAFAARVATAAVARLRHDERERIARLLLRAGLSAIAASLGIVVI